MENNMITLTGTVETPPAYSHSVLDENFYSFVLKVPRLSENDDFLPVTVPERQLDENLIRIGKLIKVRGQLRSYNKYTQTKTRLILTVFARGIAEALPEDTENPNEIDIVTIDLNDNVHAYEVKRQSKEYNPCLFQQKVEVMRNKIFKGKEIKYSHLSLADM